MRRGWEAQARNWAEFARVPGYDPTHEDINLPALLRLLPEPAGLALDLGCGEGRLGRALQPLGYRVAGVDAAPTMVRLAVSHQIPEPAVLADAAALPFRDETFGLVVAYMSLHDMDRMPEAVAEAGRVLAPQGRLVMAIPHPVNSAGSFQSRAADAPFTVAGSYLDPGPADSVVERDGVRLTFHSEHRPLESYSRALEAAGLLTEAIREPRAAAGRWQRIPLILQLRAVKP
jgi:SAM-dependent methyltransferase